MTTCVPLPGSALRYAGSVATRVLPSPVAISAILPGVEHHAAHQLDVEVAHAHGAAGRLADRGEGLGQQVVDLGAVGQPLAELGGAGAEGLVGERLEAGLERGDLRPPPGACA